MTQRTFAIIKPDAVKSLFTGKIIDRIEQENFNIVGMKKLLLSKQQAEEFYAVHKERPFYEELTTFMCSGPVVVMCLEKENAINSWRELIGSTDPEQAAPNTIRKLYAKSKGENAVHGSDEPATAKEEIQFFFPELS